jgi:cobalt-zinc-cadmium efflux system protein
MAHQHDHIHDHLRAMARPGRAESGPRLAWTLGLTLLYMVAEVVGGYLSDSLALLADAGHMLSDAAALGLSLFAAWISKRPPTPQHSYGYYRAEILAALANGATLVAISIFIFVEAFGRLNEPQEVGGRLMLSIAAGGLVINLIGLAILHGGRSANLNVHGAWLHLLSDALGSVTAIVAGGLVWWFGWNLADPVASILIGLLVIYSSWHLLQQAIAVLMEATPAHLNVEEVSRAIGQCAGVLGVHDLHIWTITSGMESLSAHVILANGHESATALEDVGRMLHDRFGIDHITIQIEPESKQQCQTSF